MEYALLTGLGLAAPAGLNAYIPLLILALADRFSTVVTLDRPYDLLSTNWGIGTIILLLTIEIVVDKVPGLDHANDLVQSAIRPAAGAILAMAATSEAVAINPVLAMILGLVAAGAVHLAKATTRPGITLATSGMGNPLVSIGEDLIATFSSLAAIFVPLLVLLFLAGFVVFFVWALRRMRLLGGARVSNGASTTLRQ